MKVLKPFEHDGEQYAPGDDIPATKLNAEARAFLLRKGCIKATRGKVTDG